MQRLVRGFVLGILLASPAALPAADQEARRLVEESVDTSKSSWIEHASFAKEAGADTGLLAVQIGGEKITYMDVPVSVWQDFKQAESFGRFYDEHIKGCYEREHGEPLWKKYDFAAPSAVEAKVQCAFNEECEPLILRYVEGARESIRVAAYAFTRTRIAAALVSAHGRGVDVRVKVDARQAEYPLAAKMLNYLARNGIPVERIAMRGDYAAMHNKFMVIDGRYVIAGSYNFTTTAGVANWENVMWADSPEIAAQYTRAWDAITSQ